MAESHHHHSQKRADPWENTKDQIKKVQKKGEWSLSLCWKQGRKSWMCFLGTCLLNIVEIYG